MIFGARCGREAVPAALWRNGGQRRAEGGESVYVKKLGGSGDPVLLLHGGGLSWWSVEPAGRLLCGCGSVYAPVIDGYGGDPGPFLSIEDSAERLLDYIGREHGGRVKALCGLSLGGQVALEALSRSPDAAGFAVIESAPVIPSRLAAALAPAACALSMPLVKSRRFARAQARELFVPPEMFESYYADSLKISQRTLANTVRQNSLYRLSPALSHTSARLLVIAGEREQERVKKSAVAVCEAVPGSRLYIAPGLGHGELSLARPEEYARLLKDFFADRAPTSNTKS